MTVPPGNVSMRCPVGWTQGVLADFVHELNERNGKRLELPVYSVTNTRGFVLQAEQFARNIHSKDTVNYKVFRRGHFGFNPSRINVGSIALNSMVDAGLLSPMYVVFVTKAMLHSSYLKHYVETYNFRRNVINGTAGSVRESLKFSAFRDFPFQFPTSTAEQIKIAQILEKVDEAIEQAEAMIAKQHRVKAGLMQDVLTRGIDEHGSLRSEQTHEFKDSPRGRIPAEWQVSLLDSLALRGSGHTPNKLRPEYWNGGIQWVSLADSHRLDNLLIQETDKEISELGLKNSSAVLHPKGTVILSRDAGVGKSAILGADMAVSQHFMAWQCKSQKLDNVYLYYWLQRDKPRFEGIASGSTIVTIGLQFFREYEIAAPTSVAEQRRISEVLSVADHAIDQIELQRRKLIRLKTALMQDLLTGKRRVTALPAETVEAST